MSCMMQDEVPGYVTLAEALQLSHVATQNCATLDRRSLRPGIHRCGRVSEVTSASG